MGERRPRLGFLTHVSGEGDPATILAETLELLVVAEQLGYESAWVAQHHVGAESGVLPSPFVFLAAAAARTQRIRLGTAVVTLPLEDPIRLAEDAAVADLLSGGRLELGVGTGAHQPSFTALGRDFEARHETGRQGLEDLLAALAGAPLPGGSPLAPPDPGLAGRVWRATASADTAAAAGRRGEGLLLARAAITSDRPIEEVQQPIAEAYLAAHRAAGVTRSPRLGLTRTVYPAADRAQAIHDLEAGTRRWSRQMPAARPLADLPVDELFRRHHVLAGPPEVVAEALDADPVVGLATDLLIQVQPGLPGFARTALALETIANAVAPLLGRRSSSLSYAE